MDTSVNAANQVVSVGADIAFDADPKFFACLVRFESSSVPTTLPTAYDVYPLDGRHDGRSEERFSRNAETDLVCRLLLEKKKQSPPVALSRSYAAVARRIDASIATMIPPDRRR